MKAGQSREWFGFFHRLSHWLKWNEVKPFGNGYICAKCGEFTKYESRK